MVARCGLGLSPQRLGPTREMEIARTNLQIMRAVRATHQEITA